MSLACYPVHALNQHTLNVNMTTLTIICMFYWLSYMTNALMNGSSNTKRFIWFSTRCELRIFYSIPYLCSISCLFWGNILYLTTLQAMAGTTPYMSLLMDGCDSPETQYAIGVWKEPGALTAVLQCQVLHGIFGWQAQCHPWCHQIWQELFDLAACICE